MLNKNFKVFISSTQRDFLDERRKVFDALQRLQIKYTAMEFFGARPEYPIEVCLNEIRTCDMFIGIIGHLYGEIVPEENISFTEMEYNAASRIGLPRLIYMKSEDVPTLPEHIEHDPSKMEKLESFKRKVKERHPIDFFKFGDELSMKVITSMVLELKLLMHPSIESLYRDLQIKDFAGDSDSFKNTLGKFIEYWTSRRLDFIPLELWRKIYLLQNSDIVKSTRLHTTYPHEQFVKLLDSIEKKFKGISPIFHKDYLTKLKLMITKRVEIELIVTSEVLKKIQGELTSEEKSMIFSYTKLKLYVYENIDSGITVSESFISLCLVSKTDITALMDKYLISYDPVAVSWGEDLFEYYKSKSERILPET